MMARIKDIQAALAAYHTRRGNAAGTRLTAVRRVVTMDRLGFPWPRFWTASPAKAQRIADQFIQDMQDDGRGDVAIDNYKRLMIMVRDIKGWGDRFQLRMSRPPPRKQYTALGHDDLHQVLATYHHEDAAAEARNLALVAISLAVKARRSEPTHIRLEDLDEANGLIYVQAAKKGLSDWMPVHPDVWPYIHDWLKHRPRPVDGSRALFTSLRGEICALKPAAVYQIMRRVGDQVGVPLNNTITRHTKATRDRQAGMPRSTRKYTIRHRSDTQLEVYERQLQAEAIEDVRRYDVGLHVDPVHAVAETCPTCGRPALD